MRKNQLNIINNVIIEKAGDDLIPIVNLLIKKGDVSENRISKDLNLELSYIRNYLYRLQDAGLSYCRRMKDDDEGIYTYFWNIDLETTKQFSLNHLNKKLNFFKEKVDKEKNTNYFGCPNECTKMEFGKCLELNFMCPECGNILMEEKKNKDKIKLINENIKKIREDIKIIKKL